MGCEAGRRGLDGLTVRVRRRGLRPVAMAWGSVGGWEHLRKFSSVLWLLSWMDTTGLGIANETFKFVVRYDRSCQTLGVLFGTLPRIVDPICLCSGMLDEAG